MKHNQWQAYRDDIAFFRGAVNASLRGIKWPSRVLMPVPSQRMSPFFSSLSCVLHGLRPGHVLVPGFILIWPVSEIGHRVDWFTDGHDADELALTLAGMHLKRCYNFTIRRHLCRNNLQPLDFPPPSCSLAPAISSLQILIPRTKRFFWFSVSNLAIPQSMNRFGPPTLQFLRRTSP
jgi:hypothetical protein